ncbi:right-handed parallel beta-helix repeat-containing protein [Halosegnis marinus]|uniref:Right-handed parallel beta-helix repeat-containing protein n=1 Tax=Halosegnis marinus TaxID=3034023 RepID=A0ABD5ZQZ9_9EURY|nr:right-handed parallel beta-helix repeat-containing protein [Halosegnis sp. DT85]
MNGRGYLAVVVTALVVLSGATPFALVGTASAATLTVDDSGGADYTTIQAAVNAASDGDTILVAPGTYAGDITIDKRLTLRGDTGDSSFGPGANAPLVDSNAGSIDEGFVLTAAASGTVIEGFVLNDFGDEGIKFDVASGATLSNVVIRDNRIGGDDDGIGQGVDGSLANIEITNNHFVSEYGIYLSVDGDVTDLSITNNRFDDGSGGLAGDESVYFSIDGTVANIDVSNNVMLTEYYGVYAYFYNATSDVTVTNNDVTADYEGIYIDIEPYDDGDAVSGVTVSNNDVTSDDYGIYLDIEVYDADVTGVTVSNNDVDSYYEAVYVDISADNGDVVDVSVDGNTLASDSDEGLYLYFDLDDDASLDGATADGNTVTTADDAGIYVELYGDSSTTTVSGLSVSDNTVSNTGDQGIYVEIYRVNTTDTIQVRDNAVANAGDEGIEFYVGRLVSSQQSVSAIVAGNVVDGSNGDGLAVDTTQGDDLTLDVTGNAFTDNANYGIDLDYTTSVESVTISGNNIAGNVAGGVRNANGSAYVDARNNWWGNASGPSSASLLDPESGTAANGTGDAVVGTLGGGQVFAGYSAATIVSGESSVRFDPFATTPFDIGTSVPAAARGGAQFVVTNLVVSPDAPTDGDEVTLTATVTNVGDGSGEFRGGFVADFRLVENVQVTLAPDESRNVSATLVVERGSYYVTIGSLTERFVVGPRPATTVSTEVVGDGTVNIEVREPRAGSQTDVLVPFVEAANETGVALDVLGVTAGDDDYDLRLRQAGDLDTLLADPEAPKDADSDADGLDDGIEVDARLALPSGAVAGALFALDGDDVDGVTVEFTFDTARYPALAEADRDLASSVVLYRYDPDAETFEQVAVTLVSATNETVTVSAEAPGLGIYALGVDASRLETTVSVVGNPAPVGGTVTLAVNVTNVGSGAGVYAPVVVVGADEVPVEPVVVGVNETVEVRVDLPVTRPGFTMITLDGTVVGLRVGVEDRAALARAY